VIAPGQSRQGRIATFYSYKGGTGRSMALANFAWILAASGKYVLAIDWDLEAPGLHRYFRPFLIDPDLFETDGLIDTFWSFAASALASTPSASRGESNSTDIIGAIDDAKRRLNWNFPTKGYIDFVGAGRQGATYSERVNTFNWKRFYELGGARMLAAEKIRLQAHYDWVLIDSRTGVSDTAGISTMQLPDTVVACFTLNRQSIDGVDAVMRSISAFRSASVDGSKIRFFPLATRIENAEQQRLEVARNYARGKLRDFLPKDAQSGKRDYWDDMEIAYRPWYAFEEVLTAFGDATGATKAADTMLSQMEAMARRVADDDKLRMPEILGVDRADVLSRYAFGTLTAPGDKTAPTVTSDPADTPKHDEADTAFLRGLLAKEQLWRKEKFSWRYLLSRRELDLLTGEDSKLFGRDMTYYITNSERGQRYFRNLNLIFALSAIVMFASALFAIAAVDPVYINKTYGVNPYPIIPMIAVICWLGVSVVGGLFLFLFGNPPYGIRLIDSILPQFWHQIHDYVPGISAQPG
jgi:cellulose biosynthesis protein BcsQ